MICLSADRPDGGAILSGWDTAELGKKGSHGARLPRRSCRGGFSLETVVDFDHSVEGNVTSESRGSSPSPQDGSASPITAGSFRRWFVDQENWLLPAISFVLFLGGWQLVATFGWINPFFIGSPLMVVQAGIEAFQDPSFWNDARVSAVEFLVGYVAAMVLAIPFGILSGSSLRLGYAVEPWVNALNATPRIALLPLIVLWVGIGQGATIVAVAIGVFFPVALNCFYGVRTVSSSLMVLAKSYGASRLMRYKTVVLPGVVPFIIAGARLGIGRGVVGVVIGEFYSSSAGLGNFIFKAAATLQVDRILFGALFITALAMLAFTSLRALELKFQAWRPATQIGGG